MKVVRKLGKVIKKYMLANSAVARGLNPLPFPYTHTQKRAITAQ